MVAKTATGRKNRLEETLKKATQKEEQQQTDRQIEVLWWCCQEVLVCLCDCMLVCLYASVPLCLRACLAERKDFLTSVTQGAYNGDVI